MLYKFKSSFLLPFTGKFRNLFREYDRLEKFLANRIPQDTDTDREWGISGGISLGIHRLSSRIVGMDPLL